MELSPAGLPEVLTSLASQGELSAPESDRHSALADGLAATSPLRSSPSLK